MITESDPDKLVIVDLLDLARSHAPQKPAWACRSKDLNANLVILAPGDGVAEHVNNEVDVLIVGIAGEGRVVVDGHLVVMAEGRVSLIPRGARRAMRANDVRFAYLTCHRRRAELWPAGMPHRLPPSSEGC